MTSSTPLRILSLLLLAGLASLLAACGSKEKVEADTKPKVTYRGQTVDHWARMLKDRDPDYRATATFALWSLGADAAEAVPALTEALGDEQPAVRAGAAQTLGNIGTAARSAEAALRKLMDDKDAEVRVSAILAMGQITGSPAPQPMVAALKDESLRVRDVASQLLVRLGAPAIEALKAATKDENMNLRVLATQVLGRIKHADAVPVLVEAMNDAERPVHDAAVLALAETGEPAIPALGKMLKDEDWQKRWAAAYALNAMGTAKVAEQLVHALNDNDDRVRDMAINAMARIGKDAIDALAKASKDQDRELRRLAILTLGNMEKTETIPILRDALKDEDPLVREAAVAGLGKTHSTQALPALGEALRSSDVKVQADAVQAMAQVGREALEPLTEASKSKEWSVRRAAAEGLGMLALVDCVAPLNRLLTDEDTRVRIAAAGSVGRIGTPARLAIAPLINAMRDESEEVRDAASLALARVSPGNESAIPAIIRALREGDAPTRLGAANALARLGAQAPSAVYPLIKALRDEDEKVVLASRLALVKLGSVAITGLAKALGEEDVTTRMHVIDVIGQIGEEASPSSHVLILQLMDENQSIRDAAVHALGLLGPEAKSALLQTSRGTDPELAKRARAALDTLLKQD